MKASDRITVRLGVVEVDRVRAVAQARGIKPAELVRQAVVKELEPGIGETSERPWSSEQYDRVKADYLPRPIELALAASVSLDQAKAWLDECEGSRSRLVELAGVELPVKA